MRSKKCPDCDGDMFLEPLESGNPHPDNPSIIQEEVWMCENCVYIEDNDSWRNQQ